MYQQIVPLSYDYENKLLECLSSEEQQQLDALIDKLYEHAGKID